VEIFELGQVAAFIGAPDSRVKNWCLGRPYAIVPSVRRAVGTGRSNLYTRNDIYLLATVNELTRGGLATRLIQDFLSYLEATGDPRVRNPREHLREMSGVLLIVGEGGRLTGVSWWHAPRNRPPFIGQQPSTFLGQYAVNLRQLWRKVDARIEKLAKKGSRSRHHV